MAREVIFIRQHRHNGVAYPADPDGENPVTLTDKAAKALADSGIVRPHEPKPTPKPAATKTKSTSTSRKSSTKAKSSSSSGDDTDSHDDSQ